MKPRRSYRVLVLWPDGSQPWLVLIEAASEADARRAVQSSIGAGKIKSVKKASKA